MGSSLWKWSLPLNIAMISWYCKEGSLKINCFWEFGNIICKATFTHYMAEIGLTSDLCERGLCHHVLYPFGANIHMFLFSAVKLTQLPHIPMVFCKNESARGVCQHSRKAMLSSTCHSVTWQIQELMILSQLALGTAAAPLWPHLLQEGTTVGEF